MKKIISLLLAVMMVVSLAACDGNNANPNLAVDYDIGDTGGLEVPFGNGETISIFAPDETNGKYGTYIWEQLGLITGLEIETLFYPSSTFTQKSNVVLASGDLPDIFAQGMGSPTKANDYANQGAFAAVDDYLDEMPNFKSIFVDNEENNWIFKSYTNPVDGKLYVLPSYNVNREVNHGMLYRKDVFDKLGIKMWDSPETFYQALKKLKAAYPDSYPLTSKTGLTFLTNYGISWGGLKPYELTFDEKTKTYFYTGTSDEMKEMLDYFKKLYNEGLLDPEFLTNTQAAWTSKMLNGSSFVTYDWIGRLDQFSEQSTIEGYDLRYGNPVGPSQTQITLAKIASDGSNVAKSKNSGLAMKLLDFLYSPAGAQLMTCGVEGVTYTINADGKAEYLEFNNSTTTTIDELREKYGMWITSTYRTVDRRSSYFSFTEREQEAQEWPAAHGGYEPADPVLTLDDETQEKETEYYNTLRKKFEEFIYKYVSDKSYGDKQWNEWVEQANKLGAQEYVKIRNEAYKASGL